MRNILINDNQIYKIIIEQPGCKHLSTMLKYLWTSFLHSCLSEVLCGICSYVHAQSNRHWYLKSQRLIHEMQVTDLRNGVICLGKYY